MFINQNKNPSHKYFMKLAITQAEKNLGNTKENPSVGCIITNNECVIAAGYTGINGRPHAEINAINFSKKNLQNSNLYVTLEPCSHYGKTPPCIKSIIKNKIGKVFFSIKDPDQRSYNKSSRILKKAGIKTIIGLCSKETNFLYKSYLKSKKSRLPYVVCKLAISKDFYSINKKKKWITNIYARSRGLLMRSYFDCILTSSKTVIKDNPLLTCRISGLEEKTPTRVILDNKMKVKINSKIVQSSNIYKTIIFYNKINKDKIKKLNKLNVKTFKVSLDDSGELNLKEVLIKLKSFGFTRIFLESGLKLITSFLQNNLIDDFKLFVSSNNLKNDGGGSIKKVFNLYLKRKKNTHEKVNLFGDKLVSYKIK